MSPRKISAAEAKRQRAQLIAERTVARTPLPAEFTDWLRTSYRPQDSALRALWPTPLLPFTDQTLLLSQIRGEEALRKHVTHLALYSAWRHQRGLPLDPRAAMNRRDVDEYARTGMPGSSEKSRSDRRSRLRVICDHLNPEQAPHAGVVIPREAIKPPYQAAQMQALVRAIQVQPTEELVRRLCLCVGLGAGAGIDSPDLKLLDTTCVTDHGEDGIRIQVPGPHAREVWVLRDHEHLVRRGVQGLRPGQPLIGRVKTRRNVAAAVYATGNIHRGYMQFTGRALVTFGLTAAVVAYNLRELENWHARASKHCPDSPLLRSYAQHPLHRPTDWVHGFTMFTAGQRAQWEREWHRELTQAGQDADLPAAA